MKVCTYPVPDEAKVTPVFCGLPCGQVTGQVRKPLPGLGLLLLPKK